MSTMKLPANYASISEEEMVYLDGGARDAYNSFLNVGKVKSFCSGFYFHLFFKNCLRCGDSSFCF